MTRPTRSDASQVFMGIRVLMTAQASAINSRPDLFSGKRLEAIARLGSAMWEEVEAAHAEANAIGVMLEEPKFVAFKAKLLNRKRVSKSAKVVA